MQRSHSTQALSKRDSVAAVSAVSTQALQNTERLCHLGSLLRVRLHNIGTQQGNSSFLRNYPPHPWLIL